MYRELLRHTAVLACIGTLMACGSDGPVGPSATTTSSSTTSVPATTTTSSSTTTTTAPGTTTSTSSIPIIIITTSTTTSIPIIVTIPTTTTTTAAASFAATVWPRMSAQCRFCHSLDNATQGFNFAFARSASNDLNSLFYRKPTGRCTAATPCSTATPAAAANPTGHTGGLQWPDGSDGEMAARNWIQNGRGM